MTVNNKFLKRSLIVWAIVVIGLIIIGASSDTKTNSPTTPAPTVTKEPDWDAEAIYPKITAEMTKTEAEKVIGKTSDNCTESAIAGIGSSEICVYSGGFGSKGSIVVTYMGNKVYSKTKTGF